MQICEEMLKLRRMLDEIGVKWEDVSSIRAEEDIEFIRRVVALDKARLDDTIYRTHFEYGGTKWSVINGYGTYGGYDPFTGKNKGLLELYDYENDVEGWLTADDVINKIKNEVH